MKNKFHIGVENIVRKGEIACYKQFLLFSQCFPQLYIFSASKCGIVCGNVWCISTPLENHSIFSMLWQMWVSCIFYHSALLGRSGNLSLVGWYLSTPYMPHPGGSVVSVSDSWPGGCEFDPRLRRLFFPVYYRLSPLQKHVRKVVGGFGKKSCVSTGVRKPGNTCASPTAMIWP